MKLEQSRELDYGRLVDKTSQRDKSKGKVENFTNYSRRQDLGLWSKVENWIKGL